MENCLLAFYSFQLGFWNYLDFIMVCGGILDLWLVPLFRTIIATLHPSQEGGATSGGGVTSALKVLKIMRILRVLRLVRLLKMVKPLYRLFIGVWKSVESCEARLCFDEYSMQSLDGFGSCLL